MGSLALTIFEHQGKALFVHPDNDSSLPETPLVHLIKIIHFLPMTWRKWLLDLCRIQADPTVNTTIANSFSMLEPAEVLVDAPREPLFILHKNRIMRFATNIYDSPLCCTILSYFVRAETTAFVDQFLEVYEATVTKETSAALFYRPHENNLEYNALFGDFTRGLSPYTFAGSQSRVSLLVQRNLENFKALHSRQQSPILFPIYNRRKNIGLASQEEYHRALFGENWTDIDCPNNITTLDLLRHYHQYGQRIGGPLEVRCVWKYGDLKPRVYYCNGGESYWCSLYIKPIVNYLLTALPSTNPASRYEVQRLGTLQSDQLLVTYDYTSFTTSLSELKFYLHHLADQLVGTTVRCLDVREGVVDIDVGEYLHAYNKAVNIHQEIDLRRLNSRDMQGGSIFYQGRSGSLGVQGNIGFSMNLHGISLGSFTSIPDRESDVGDDALTIILSTLLPYFIEHTNLLGEIHPEKYTTMCLPPEDNPCLATEQAYKYLKRPLTVDFLGKIQTGVLDFFPSVADFLFPDGDGIHSSVMSTDPIVRVRSLCSQWGRYLRLTHQDESIDRTADSDMELIVEMVALCYDSVGLPKEGGIPGTRFFPTPNGPGEVADFFIPACDSIDVFLIDWVESLYSAHNGARIVSPVRAGGTMYMDPWAQPGSRLRVTDGDRTFRLLRDLGYIHAYPIVEELVFDNAYVRRLEKIMYGDGGETVYEALILKELPDWFFPIASEYYYSLEIVDVNRKLDDIRSITESSFK